MKRIFCIGIIILVSTIWSHLIYSKEERGVRLGDYFSFLEICDWSYRKTNIYLEDYDFMGGWSYTKIVWDRIIRDKKSKSLPVGIYISGVIAYSNQDKPWENNYVFGIGVEKYIFENVKGFPSLFKNIRLYAEYLKIGYTKQKAEEWIPNYDYRIGLDIYKDYGIGKEDTNKFLWREIWANLSWQKTNFFMKDYKSVSASMNVKIGFRIPKYTQLSLMPYLVIEASGTSKHDFFWQNRGFFGGGLRVMPFQKAKIDLWNRFKIFVEYIGTVSYFKEKPTSDIPDFDIRVGFTFSIGFWR